MIIKIKRAKSPELDSVTLGDSLEVMRDFPANFFHAVVTDPPYGIRFMGKAWDGADIDRIVERENGYNYDPARMPDRKMRGEFGVSSARAAGKYDTGPDAMRNFQAWTAAWAREALRVLKPGGHLLSFASTRTYHRMACGVEDAGFEIRDQIGWVFGSGFPKSMDVSKALDKMSGIDRCVEKRQRLPSGWPTSVGGNLPPPVSEMACKWSGWGTALKPAWEPVVVARKPLEGTVAANVLRHGAGGINIGACRIGSDARFNSAAGNKTGDVYSLGIADRPDAFGRNCVGRWPANLVHDGSPEVSGLLGAAARFFYCAKASRRERFAYLTCDCETVSIESWVSEDRHLKGQTGCTSRKKGISEGASTENCGFSTESYGSAQTGVCQKDTKSTIKTTIKPITRLKTLSLSARPSTSGCTEAACEKAGAEDGSSRAGCAAPSSPSSRATGTFPEKAGRCTGVVVPVTSPLLSRQNVCEKCGAAVKREQHPTQKPIDLMRWLVRLVAPPGGIVLEPFAGSGTTLAACAAEGARFVGIERDENYIEIARARAAHALRKKEEAN